MKELIEHFDAVFENRIRLAIMSLLMVNESLDFNSLKEQLGLTDGNLASHAAALERKRLILVKKEFVGRIPKTKYSATREGRRSFTQHLDILEKLIRKNK